jgi:hypothetical protein
MWLRSLPSNRSPPICMYYAAHFVGWNDRWMTKALSMLGRLGHVERRGA